ncbi:MAG: hypothetical protein ACYC41_04185 [Bacillota bacterium]
MTELVDGRRPKGGEGPGALAIARFAAVGFGGGLRLLALLLFLLPRINAWRRRAKRSFRRTLAEAGLPSAVVDELAALYPGLGWRDLLPDQNLSGVPFVGRRRVSGSR